MEPQYSRLADVLLFQASFFWFQQSSGVYCNAWNVKIETSVDGIPMFHIYKDTEVDREQYVSIILSFKRILTNNSEHIQRETDLT